jgi:hypothetical protein
MLEGVATGLSDIDEIAYDRKFNAFVLDGHAAYFIAIPPKTVAELCRALAENDLVGVSLGRKHLVYGAVPKNSEMAFDLKLADHFLGEIVFAQNNWTRGYQFAEGFTPKKSEDDFQPLAVFFRFNGIRLQVESEEVLLKESNFDVRLVPLTASSSPDGNLVADEEAVRERRIPPEFEFNASHLAGHMDRYRREQIVRRAFAYAEVAAFLRWLKGQGADLQELASQIE